MANYPRHFVISDKSTFHVTWKCHNNQWLLKEDWAKKIYYELLIKYKSIYKIHIYSYCFMSNHPHLSGFCDEQKLFSDFFRMVNSCFAKKYNKQMKRRGQVVMDRFKSPRIQTEVDLLKVMIYIDLNPKRAHMVPHPKDYKWSSYAHYAFGKEDPLIDEAPSYTNLGLSPKERQKAYRELVEEILLHDWKEKKDYSSVSFIGNPDWVWEKVIKIRQSLNEKKKDWRIKLNTRLKILDQPRF